MNKIKEFWLALIGSNNVPWVPQNPPRKLTKEEVKFMVDYFHNRMNCPDKDGYVGHYNLPEEVMIEYNKKYGKMRGFTDD